MSATSPRFHPPQQSRSQETLGRILDAAERVLEEKSFTEATLAEIMERAGVTVGAFYRRFPDKDALLHHLDQRFFTEMHELTRELLDPVRWDGQPLARIIPHVTAVAVPLYRMRRGLLRTLFIRARSDATIQQSARELNGQLLKSMKTLAEPRREEITHPNPLDAVEFGFKMFLGSLRETVVFGEVWPQDGVLPDEQLAHELARMYLGYLGTAGPVHIPRHEPSH